MTLNYDYAAAKAFTEELGLTWLGDDYPPLVEIDGEAAAMGMTQQQVDRIMRAHLLQIKALFDPASYTEEQRRTIAAHFLTGG